MLGITIFFFIIIIFLLLERSKYKEQSEIYKKLANDRLKK